MTENQSTIEVPLESFRKLVYEVNKLPSGYFVWMVLDELLRKMNYTSVKDFLDKSRNKDNIYER